MNIGALQIINITTLRDLKAEGRLEEGMDSLQAEPLCSPIATISFSLPRLAAERIAALPSETRKVGSVRMPCGVGTCRGSAHVAERCLHDRVHSMVEIVAGRIRRTLRAVDHVVRHLGSNVCPRGIHSDGDGLLAPETKG